MNGKFETGNKTDHNHIEVLTKLTPGDPQSLPCVQSSEGVAVCPSAWPHGSSLGFGRPSAGMGPQTALHSAHPRPAKTCSPTLAWHAGQTPPGPVTCVCACVHVSEVAATLSVSAV